MPEILIYLSGGNYKMHVENFEGDDVNVEQIFNVIESQIEGDFEGWEGETIYSLINGQIWQQSDYYYHYHYAFQPKVFIYKSGIGYKMRVEGDDEKEINVKRLK